MSGKNNEIIEKTGDGLLSARFTCSYYII